MLARVWRSALVRASLIAVALAIGVVIVLTIAQRGFEPRLTRAFARSFAEGRPLAIESVTSFKWEKLHVFHPYYDSESIDSDLGFKWIDWMKSEIEYNESIALLVFVRDERVVKALLFPRSSGDMAQLEWTRGVSPRQAVITVVNEGTASDGGRWLVARPAQTADRPTGLLTR